MTTLFLKYRPQIFADLVGQESIQKTLKNAIKNQNPAHAYLFCGSRGTGKTSTARIFAKALNCQNQNDGDPCGTCEICTQTAEGSLLDVIEIDGASNRGIDEIRDLREKVSFLPNFAARKIYIIDEVHMLTREAFNALLKTLEEPPDHAFFCLATTEIHKVPQTILSRCQTFIFQKFPETKLVERLEFIAEKEKFEVEKEALELIARKAEGGMRDAISLLEQMAAETENHISARSVRGSLGISDQQTLENFWAGVLEKDTEKLLQILATLSKNGGDFRTFAHDFLKFLREKMHENLSQKQTLSQILAAIEETEKAVSRLKQSPIPALPLEIAAVNLTQNLDANHHQISAPVKKEVPKVAEKETEKPEKISENSDGFEFNATSKPEKIELSKKSTEPKNSGIESETLAAKMPEIAEKAGLPSFAKKSFLANRPEVSGSKIIFCTDSYFHAQKCEPHQDTISKAVSELFGQNFEIEFVVESGEKPQKNSPASAADWENFPT